MKSSSELQQHVKENKKGGTIGKTSATTLPKLHPNPQNFARAITSAKKWVAVNDKNLRIGESHPRAVLTDRDVELLLELRDEGHSYRWLAEKMEISVKQAWRICTGRQRSQIAHGHRRVLVP